MLVGFLTLLVLAAGFLAVLALCGQAFSLLIQLYFLVNGLSCLIACLVIAFIEKPWRKIKRR